MRTKYLTAALLCGLTSALLAGCASREAPPENPAPEEVSIGYGTQRPEERTGAVTSLSSEELEGARATRVEELLQGRVAGLEVTRLPNGEFSLRIRGAGSLVGGNEPLIVIDNVQVAPRNLRDAFAGMSPGDIRRVEVLKDAASTAIYGSRGANGVILITTKRGH